MMAALTILSVAVFAQDTTKQKVKTKQHKTEKITYSCPMHPDMVMDKPGKCPTCGMALQSSKKEQMKMKEMGLFTCPMHPDVTSDKSGKCAKCGMDFKPVKAQYSCPNHHDVTSDKPGKCSKCET